MKPNSCFSSFCGDSNQFYRECQLQDFCWLPQNLWLSFSFSNIVLQKLQLSLYHPVTLLDCYEGGRIQNMESPFSWLLMNFWMRPLRVIKTIRPCVKAEGSCHSPWVWPERNRPTKTFPAHKQTINQLSCTTLHTFGTPTTARSDQDKETTKLTKNTPKKKSWESVLVSNTSTKEKNSKKV